MKKIYFDLNIPSNLHRYNRPDLFLHVKASIVAASTDIMKPIVLVEFLDMNTYEFECIKDTLAVRELAEERAEAMFLEINKEVV